MDKDKALELIQKLIVRTEENGATQSEAEAATAEVQRLLMKFNLSLEEVDKVKPQDFVEEVAWENARDKIAQQVAGVVQSHFFIQAILTDRGIRFLGSPHNVEVAKYIFDFLRRQFMDLCSNKMLELLKADPSQGIREIDRKIESYVTGLACGLSMRLSIEKSRASEPEKNALALIGKDLHDAVSQRYPGAEEHTLQRPDQVDHKTMIGGFLDGHEIQIREGLGADQERSERLAIGKRFSP